MNWKKIFAVIRREYVERIRTKAFWIGTALIPVFFFLYIAIQVATSHRAGGERHIAVVDATGHLYEPLVADVAARENAREQSSEGKGIHWVLERRPLAACSAYCLRQILRLHIFSALRIRRTRVPRPRDSSD
jgi:ABC-type Na+ efflux pump permease subunit